MKKVLFGLVALLGAALPTVQAKQDFNERISLSAPLPAPACLQNGDTVINASGFLHVKLDVDTFNFNPTTGQGTLSAQAHVNGNLKGTGNGTNATSYVINGNAKADGSATFQLTSATGGSAIVTVEAQGHLNVIGRGRAGDLKLHFKVMSKFQVTVANGQVTNVQLLQPISGSDYRLTCG